MAAPRVSASVFPLVAAKSRRTSSTVGPAVCRRFSALTPGTSRYDIIMPSIRPSFETLRNVAKCRLMLAADRCEDSRWFRNPSTISCADGDDWWKQHRQRVVHAEARRDAERATEVQRKVFAVMFIRAARVFRF